MIEPHPEGPLQLNMDARLRSLSLYLSMRRLRRVPRFALLALAVPVAAACSGVTASGGGAPPAVALECPALATQARMGEPGAIEEAVHSWLCAPEAVDAAASGLQVLAAREPADRFQARLRRLPMAPDSAVLASLFALASDPTLPELTRALAGEHLDRAIQLWASPKSYAYATAGPGEPADCTAASGVERVQFSHGSVSAAWRPPSADLAARWRQLRAQWQADPAAAIARRRVAHGCLADSSAP